jgi:ubiquinone/menaquinone biosynthesis C-methylase UbiE
MSKPRETAVYTHGHHESVLRSHTWRTAANSAGYLLGSLKPHMKVLDIGCGPGTITADLAELVPDGHVTGVDRAPEILEQARATAAGRGLANIDFAVADVHALDHPDDTFCVVHAHQVLQHVGDPVQALREMVRVTRPGGFIAVRDSDYAAMTWYPRCPAWTTGWTCTAGWRAPTGASRTRDGGCTPGRWRPGSPT